MRLKALAAALLLAACSPQPAPTSERAQMTDAANTDPRRQAERLIGEVARRQGRTFAGLPDTNVIAYGPVSFRYDARTETVAAAILLDEFFSWTVFPEDRPQLEKTLAALNNPAIGGMFDTGGGEWLFDRETGKLHLAVRRPVTASPEELRRAFERIEHVYPDWRLTWFAAVADMVHEGAAPPAQRVTVERNPYRRD